MIIPFWGNEPFILLSNDYIFELLPSPKMAYEQKINSITRLILLLTLLGYIFTFSNRLLIVCLITLSIIYTLYKYKMKKNDNQEENLRRIKEGFHTNDKQITIMDPVSLKKFVKSEFKEGNKKNPFSNVLLTEITDDPNRKSAPPAFNEVIDTDITTNIKKSVQFMNPGIDDTNKQLFSSLTDNFYLDQSNRAFFSTANTRVSNDQGAFANFLYSDLKFTSKESTPEGSIARVKDSYRHTLY
jgi:hypothetical protein